MLKIDEIKIDPIKKAVTVWIDESEKERYDRLKQFLSDKYGARKARHYVACVIRCAFSGALDDIETQVRTLDESSL